MLFDTSIDVPNILVTNSLRLPTELWLQIYEHTDIHDAIHLWTSIRYVSRQFRDCVERLFVSKYLPQFSISLALPRRDPTSGALRWPGGPIPKAQIVFSFSGVSQDQQYAFFTSPVVLTEGFDIKSVEELKEISVLPKERLQAAPPWLYFTSNPLTGLKMKIPGEIDWNNTQLTWVWKVDWRTLITQFYKAKGMSKKNPGLSSYVRNQKKGHGTRRREKYVSSRN